MTVDWELVIRYLAGLCSDQERETFEQWLAESPEEHGAALDSARTMVAEARREVSANRAAEILSSLNRATAVAESAEFRSRVLHVVPADTKPVLRLPRSTPRFKWQTGLKVAAALLLVVGGAVVWATLSKEATVSETAVSARFRDMVAPLGQRVAFHLPDGSAGMLAPGSRLRVSRDYGVDDRTVTLVGQALFTVTHDAAHPFSVRTARSVVEDIGTQFVVREYQGEAETVVAVAEGEVELRGVSGKRGRGTQLTQGQMGRIKASGVIAVSSDVDLDRYLAWTEGQLVFQNTPLREAAAELARWYDVDIRLASAAIAQQHLTATVKYEAVDDVLRTVAVSLDLALDVDRSHARRVFTLRAR